MRMLDHVNNVCKAAYLQVRIIGHLRPYLSTTATKTLVRNLIINRIDYCNSLLFGAPKFILNKLQRLQNMAARLVTRVKRSSHITPSLFKLHWLPIEYRIQFRILVHTYRSIHESAPGYLCTLIKLRSSDSVRHLRTCDDLSLVVNRTRLKTFGDRAFSNCAPTLWNNLPVSIRLQDSESSFRKSLKTLMFNEAFNL